MTQPSVAPASSPAPAPSPAPAQNEGATDPAPTSSPTPAASPAPAAPATSPAPPAAPAGKQQEEPKEKAARRPRAAVVDPPTASVVDGRAKVALGKLRGRVAKEDLERFDELVEQADLRKDLLPLAWIELIALVSQKPERDLARLETQTKKLESILTDYQAVRPTFAVVKIILTLLLGALFGVLLAVTDAVPRLMQFFQNQN